MASGACDRRVLEVHDLGVVDYGTATRLQEARVDACAQGAPDAIFLLEHPPVYTLGRGAEVRHLGSAAQTGIPIVRSARGGQVTYHGPGQLVAYPIVDLGRRGRDVRAYVSGLEDAVIRMLGTLGLVGTRWPGNPGVWVARRKIGSIGIAVRRWVTWHGVALNVRAETAPFAAITPCGIAGLEMTSIEAEGVAVSMGRARAAFLDAFVDVFGYQGAGSVEHAASGASA